VKHVSSLLSKELENIYHRYLHIHNLHSYNTPCTYDNQILLGDSFFEKKTCNFFQIPPLLPFSSESRKTFSESYHNKQLIFSGKSAETESSFFESQLHPSIVLLPILSIPDLQVIDTIHGGVHYFNKKLSFILVPRSESIGMKDPKSFISSLSKLEKTRPNLSSNRGSSRNVFFEIETSNYVDFGVGVCRGMTGLYIKQSSVLNDKIMKPIHRALSFIHHISEKYIPKSLLKSLNKGLNDIDLEPFDSLLSYKEMKFQKKSSFYNINAPIQSSHLNGKSHSFMPSTSFGRNNALSMHIDDDSFLSIVHVQCRYDLKNCSNGKSKYSLQSDIVKYFTFDDKFSVALRSGDILIFNPVIPHCISTSTDQYSSHNVYCISHYLKSKIIGRNNNSISF